MNTPPFFTRAGLFLGLLVAASGCADVDASDDEPIADSQDALTGFSAAQVTKSVAYGESVLFSTSDITGKTVVGTKFQGAAGDVIEAWMMVDSWSGTGNEKAVLIGPNGHTELAKRDPAVSYTKDARIRFTLTQSGTHYLAFRKGTGFDGGDGTAVIHLEKKGGARAALAASPSADTCSAHPWPMKGQCRDAAYRSKWTGPLSGQIAWTKTFAWSRYEDVADVAVSRDGTAHVLHGPDGGVLGFTGLVYSAFTPTGTKLVSERFDVGNVARAELSLDAGGSPYMLLPYGVFSGAQKGTLRGSLFRIDARGVGAEIGALRTGTLLDGFPENTGTTPKPLLRIDGAGRPYVRALKPTPNQSGRYLGDIERLDPATNVVSSVPGALSNEPVGYVDAEYALAGGDRVADGGNGVERRNAANRVLWTIFWQHLSGIDVAHDHVFVRRREGQLTKIDVHSLATGALLWSTTPRKSIPRAPLVHANGDIAFAAGRDSYDDSFEVWGANGALKAAVSMPSSGESQFALDAAGTTYAAQRKRVVAIDTNGTTRFDLALPSEASRIVVGADQTIYVLSTTQISAIRP